MKREKEANPKLENLPAVNLDLEIEEFEPIAAPSFISNSNETLISYSEEQEAEIEESVHVVAPLLVIT